MRPRESLPAQKNSRNDIRTIRTLLPYLWPKDAFGLRARVVIALVLLAISKVATVVVPVILKHAVDTLSKPGAGGVVLVPVGLLLAYGLARILSQVFRELQGAIFAKVAERAIRQAGLKTFRHLHKLSLRFHLDRQTGGLSRAIERGARGIEFLLRVMLFNIIPTIIEIILVTGLLWKILNFWFALATLSTIAAYVVWTLAVTEWRTHIRRRMNENDSMAHTKAIDSLLNYETVKYFGNEDHEARRFDVALQGYEKAAIESKTSLALLNVGQGAIIAIGVTIVMIMAASGVANGALSIGDFVLVNTYLLQLYLPLNFLGSVYREIKYSLADMEAMFSLLNEAADVTDIPGAPPLIPNGAEIRFEDVSFAYDPRRPVLKSMSFTVPAGRTVAIVGPSGAGKSTISRLLFRFYDVTSGRVTIDGQDIRRVAQNSLRRAIGIVPQDTVLFNDSIYYNIAYGRPEASPAQVEDAARMARIHDFVMSLPDGYQTIVGERGLKLSGGEKQRVAIARTILKQPAILLFDEATSALDSHTEREIQASLREVSTDRTTLVIAHRLSTVVDADEILVLEDGVISERGGHTALLEKNGVYAAMWRRQQEASQALETLERTGENMRHIDEASAL
ncbi:ABCB family ABC transporter ATP-binding protein/permease [Varunaivibrio sulfuroxidans]|uniref:ATP-binding cassette subfamily B protein n=1 Tax=Varunaivibrio sulfuroxidans TaxID=1773489 RepID=A0A4R3J8K9_9PROT|nr:ABC transporter ATP-binding protein/permease [Varunaivibrio sulfuroxidans]TCS62178.1 ATP-binding cassette subfamily B protein [Varunaivibrio sulfuroxidans]WES30605.1 ABC transporter ATP-binding protein/permease [Varunaivibrio sulfuroxidans]